MQNISIKEKLTIEIIGDGSEATQNFGNDNEAFDENSNFTGGSYTFPAGSIFNYLRSDGLSYVDMLAGDG